MTASATNPRTPTPIDEIAEDWVDTLVDLDPDTAIWLGRPGRLTEFGDHSPAGVVVYDEAARRVITRLEEAEPVDDVDRVTRSELLTELRLDLEQTAAGLPWRDLNVIASPAQGIRDSFDLMPTTTAEDWATIAGRLRSVPTAIDGYLESLREGIRRDIVPARRQVVEVIRQARDQAAPTGFFADFAATAEAEEGALSSALQSELVAAAETASAGYEKLAAFLESELAPVAASDDAVGRELYALLSRRFLGSTIDLDEAYEWGIAELDRTVLEQARVARRILEPQTPGADSWTGSPEAAAAAVHDAVELLDRDPERRLHGTEALRAWMQQLSDAAVDALVGVHFDIPEPLRRLECLIAPTQTGGIYYTGPSDDFSRPGRMWWSVPAGVTEFATWRETTTVYHEGVPGHHLQIGQAVYNSGRLNTWRRHFGGTSGHAEGWALYAERLMADLGFLDDPADRLGMLDGQRMRAARVVVDIGVHLGKTRPDGAGICDAEWALAFMRRHVSMADAFIRFEVDRYLGWPGQAPSYRIGQRIWEELRDETAHREGDAFDLRGFHSRALAIGGVGLDTLRAEVRR